MKVQTLTALSLAAASLMLSPAMAQTKAAPAPAVTATATPAPVTTAGSAAPAVADLTAGQVRKVDLENKKITIKHGDIKNLGMPGMTMVFQVKDAALLAKVKTADKVLFFAEKEGSNYFVTHLQMAP